MLAELCRLVASLVLAPLAIFFLLDFLFPGEFLAFAPLSTMGETKPLVVRNLTSNAVQIRSVGDENVSLSVEPFQTLKTEKTVAQKAGITFSTGGDDHHLNYQPAKFSCHDLTPASENSATRLTAINVPASGVVAVFSSANLASWMKNLKDDTPVSGLSIPGTHNAPAYHHALPSVRCQAVSPREQLDNGVRFFDIRARPLDPSKEDIELCHAVFPVSLTGRKYFRKLVDDIFAFLEKNPSETVLMTVKREGLGHATDQQLSKVLHDHYASDPARWFTAPRVPYLGEVRGKIVLIRRFNLDDSLKGEYGGAGWCIDACGWADNTPDATCPSGDVRIQDFYQVMKPSEIPTKTTYVTQQMINSSAVVTALPPTATSEANNATAGPTPTAAPGEGSSQGQPAIKQPIFMNFLTASNFFNPACWPERIAAKLNPKVLEYLCTQHNSPGDDGNLAVGDGCTGIVVCDWVGRKGNWDLVRAIVGWNARLEYRETATKTI